MIKFVLSAIGAFSVGLLLGLLIIFAVIGITIILVKGE